MTEMDGKYMTNAIINISDYPYKYEMHLHTSEASACGKNTAEEMVRAHKQAGYTGIVITNHAWGGNTCIDRKLPYRQWVRQFAVPYYKGLEEGNKIGLDVFFGWEAGFNATEFLIYGLSPQWLMDHEELWEATISQQFEIVNAAGGAVIHAHPFREESYIPEIRLFPEYVHGVEMVNATHSGLLSRSHKNPDFDKRAINYARQHNLPGCAGSDVHCTTVLGGGILLKEKITSDKQIASILKSGEDYLLTNGHEYYDKSGNLIESVVK